MTDVQIWQWTLTKEAIAPCFVRDVLAMRQSTGNNTDFFWLGHTPCRTVLLVGMVVAIQNYDKRAIYTIDDGTAVIDCVLRHPPPSLPAPAPSRCNGSPSAKANPQRSPPKRPRLGKVMLESMEPPAPITEPGYPVRVVGKVVRHYESKQIYADTIDPCPSTLDEITHLERVIELHKTKYSRAVPFVLPPKPTSSAVPLDKSPPRLRLDADASVFSNTSLPSRPNARAASYKLPAPPCPLQNRNPAPSKLTHVDATYHAHTHVPSSPTASSIASSTPSSPCKLSSPLKTHEAQDKPRLRHPSRLHTRDLTANTFRLYVKHYMDNAPPPFLISCASPSRSTCRGLATPTKHARDNDESDEPTPRPPLREEDEGGPTLGFTLAHLRRVPELALLAARVVRAESRKRDKADREKEKEQTNSRITSSTSASSGRPNGSVSAPMPRTKSAADPPRKKIKRLFSWAVVKLYEEGTIILWDGDVRPLPVPPPEPAPSLGLWNDDTTRSSALDRSSASRCVMAALRNADTSTLASVLYTASASASLYSHYHAPRRERDVGVDAVETDADPAYLSDPPLDEEAYVPLTPQFLAEYVRAVVGAMRTGKVGCGRGGVGAGANGGLRAGGTGREPTAEDVLTYMQRTDARWARVGVWAVEEAFAITKAG